MKSFTAERCEELSGGNTPHRLDHLRLYQREMQNAANRSKQHVNDAGCACCYCMADRACRELLIALTRVSTYERGACDIFGVLKTTPVGVGREPAVAE